MQELDTFVQMVSTSKNLVFFGGAGVSTESGIPDFRSVDGLYSQKYKYPPEYMLSHTCFEKHTDEFYRFYKDKMIFKNAKPNVTHLTLAKLEQAGLLKAIVTQNIDGLHEMAGSKVVYNLHGTVYKNTCLKCGRKYPLEKVTEGEGIPRCDCGGIVKPDVVLYEESLPDDAVMGAIKAISACDCLIVGGTSLTVYPAASYLDFYRGNKLILINKSSTSLDGRADLVITKGLGECFSYLADKMGL